MRTMAYKLYDHRHIEVQDRQFHLCFCSNANITFQWYELGRLHCRLRPAKSATNGNQCECLLDSSHGKDFSSRHIFSRVGWHRRLLRLDTHPNRDRTRFNSRTKPILSLDRILATDIPHPGQHDNLARRPNDRVYPTSWPKYGWMVYRRERLNYKSGI